MRSPIAVGSVLLFLVLGGVVACTTIQVLPAPTGTGGSSASSSGADSAMSSTGATGSSTSSTGGVSSSSSASSSASGGGATTSTGAGGAGGAGVCVPGAIASCYSGPANTQGIGLCQAGMQTCNPQGTAFGPCQGEVLPGVEVCGNGLDEDCNGADEACPLKPDGASCTASSQCQSNQCTVQNKCVQSCIGGVGMGMSNGTISFCLMNTPCCIELGCHNQNGNPNYSQCG